jgi:ElaB/YqjD/DUF883 family membrane-anchored ribosome-binding protein
MKSDELKSLDKVCSDEAIMEMRKRNEERLKEAKERLGERYLLHPKNRVVKTSQKGYVLS